LASSEPLTPSSVAQSPVAPTSLAPSPVGASASQVRAGQQGLASPEHTSLDQRLGALQMVRLVIVGLVCAAAASFPAQLGLRFLQVLPLSAAYVTLCLAGQLADYFMAKAPPESRKARRSRAPVQQMLLPVDSAYLALLMVPAGAAQSDFVLLFTVQLIAVTLLASPRTGVRLAMWDSALLLAISVLQLGGPVGKFLGTPQVVNPSSGAVALRIVGFWAVALSTAYFSTLSERELRRSKAHLDALTKMASEMEQSMEASCGADEIVAILLRSVASAFAFKRVAIVWEKKGRLVAAKFAVGDAEVPPVQAAPPGREGKRALSGEVAARALATNAPVLVHRLSSEADPSLDEIVPGATNLIVIPIRAGHDRLGLLLAEAGPPFARRVSRRSLDMLNRFAVHAALTINNAHLQAEVARLASSDALTGLANRRQLDFALGREVARTVRTNEPLSVALIDIDHFKDINDTFGHVAGDEVLREVAGALARSVRDVDLVARYGGEEFAIVLPNCASTGALVVIERVRAAVASVGGVAKVTVSAGIATGAGEGTDGDSLVAGADEALYESKRAGRDRATLAFNDQPLLVRPPPTAPAAVAEATLSPPPDVSSPSPPRPPRSARRRQRSALVQGGAQSGGQLGRDPLTLVDMARPQEASQSVPGPSGDNVQVHVGHALADGFVESEKGSVCP
jgi:two-component system cell cycle response regulator